MGSRPFRRLERTDLIFGLGFLVLSGALATVVFLPDRDDRLARFSNLATAFSAPIALLALLVASITSLFAAQQLSLSRKVAKHQFLLQFFTMVQEYNTIHVRLRDGEWAHGEGGPKDEEEWNTVRRYLGLLSGIRSLIADGIMDIKTADIFYSHRLVYLLNNKTIRTIAFERDRELNPDLDALVGILKTEPVFRRVQSRLRSDRGIVLESE